MRRFLDWAGIEASEEVNAVSISACGRWSVLRRCRIPPWPGTPADVMLLRSAYRSGMGMVVSPRSMWESMSLVLIT